MRLFLDEPGARQARETWRDAPARVASVALIAEARAALAAAFRSRRIDADGHAEALVTFAQLWHEIDGIELTESLAIRAGELAEAFSLRGYDAIHLASAEAVADEDTVLVTADEDLASAAASLGISAVIPRA